MHNLQPGTTKSEALKYAARGWHVFPLIPRDKNPLTTHGFHDATVDPDQIVTLWRDQTFANVGIATGASGLVGIDVDTKKGKIGGQTWERLVAEHGHVDTYTVRTWSGGLHYIYQDPHGLRSTTGQEKNGRIRGLGQDVDTRGVGGYLVAPPSIVREGDDFGQYEVLDDRTPLLVPDWIVEALRASQRPETLPGMPQGPVADSSEVEARVRALASELEQTETGANNEAARLAYMAGQYVGAGQIDQDTAIGILLDAVAGWSWAKPRDADTMAGTIINQVVTGGKNPRPWEASSAAVAVLAPDSAPMAPVPEGAADDPVAETERGVSMWSTDNGQGVFLRDRVGNMLYAVGVGWLVWDGKRWKASPEEVIRNRVSRFYRQQFEKSLARYAETMDEKFAGLAKSFKTFMSTARLGSILAHLKVTDGVLVDVSALDSQSDLLNCENGIVDLRTGQISPHEPTMLFTKITAGNYRPGFTHPDWIQAQTALPPAEADYMQIRFGQAITGRTPESDDVLFLVGHGSNGKSSWATDGVFPAVGDYAALAQPTLIMKQTDSGSATPERAALRGCRFVLIEELPEGRSLSIAEIKRITGTGVITARDLWEKQFTFVATHTLFVTSNFLPPVAEVDEGSWRRLCCVRFPYRFRTSPEGPDDRPGDAGLRDRLRHGDANQHDAIVTWLVTGAMRYFADPTLIMDDRRPDAIKVATIDWRKDADRILAYVEERICPDEAAMVFRGDLYADFCAFLEERGHAKWSQETFLSRFRSHERVRNMRVAEGRVRNHDDISRPALPPGVSWSSARPVLPKQPAVFRGIKFLSNT